VVVCLERGADLHTAQLMPLPLTVSCFSKIPTGFTFLVPAHLGGPGKRAVKRVCVCVCVCVGLRTLVVATATIPEAFYEDWKHTYYRASTSLQNRQRNLDEAAELIERVSNTR